MWEDNRGRNVYCETDEEEIKKLLIGRKVKVIEKDEQRAKLELDNGVILEVEANEGCGRLFKRLVFNNKFKQCG